MLTLAIPNSLVKLEARAVQTSYPDKTTAEREANESETCQDDRSPLQKFRSYPRKPLSVSDLTAGAWCELKYWYTLTRLPGGRPTKTPAMQGGSKIHKQLEEQVHSTVQVNVLTKEDGFALRLWNFIQGLRTLRDNGLTRELEVWGVVHGNFVNGVIDALTRRHPDPEHEEKFGEKESHSGPKQTLLAQFFKPSGEATSSNPASQIFLSDVKTRGSMMPVSNSVLRPAEIQLLLYHCFLSDIAAGKLDFLKLLRRYGLDPDDTLSDDFMAQMEHVHGDTQQESATGWSESSTNRTCLGEESPSADDGGLLKYKTLRQLVSLVRHEVELTFPEGETSIGQILRVQYIHRDDGREIHVHDFPASSQALQAYLTSYMRWWQGERKAVGVEIEEAFKCRSCEFSADCSWRVSMAEGQIQKAEGNARARKKARKPLVYESDLGV